MNEEQSDFQETPKPLLVVIVGISGSGKSTLGLRILEQLRDAVLFDADNFPLPCGVDFGTEEGKFTIYKNMLRSVRATLVKGHDTIFCQTLSMENGHFTHPIPTGRIGLIQLAKSLNVRIAFIHCTAPTQILLNRLIRRIRSSRSGMPWDRILQRQLENWEPLTMNHFHADTTITVNIEEVKSFLELTRNPRMVKC